MLLIRSSSLEKRIQGCWAFKLALETHIWIFPVYLLCNPFRIQPMWNELWRQAGSLFGILKCVYFIKTPPGNKERRCLISVSLYSAI